MVKHLSTDDVKQNEGHGQRQMVEAVDVRVVPLLEDEKIHKDVQRETKKRRSCTRTTSTRKKNSRASPGWRISPRSRSAASEPELRSSILDRPAACKPTSLDKPTSAASSSAAATTKTSHVLSSTTDPFDGDDEDGRSDGSGVDPVAPAVLVDPHSDGQNSKHGDGRTLRFVKVAQSCKLWFWTFMQLLTDQSDPHGERRAVDAEIFQDVVSHEAQDGQTWTVTCMQPAGLDSLWGKNQSAVSLYYRQQQHDLK